MGTWNSKPFGNDTALDWVYDLVKSAGGEFIHKALDRTNLDDEELDAPDCEEVIAASVVVLASSKNEIKMVPVEVKQWIREKGYVPDKEHIFRAISSITQILKDSELLELWNESDNPKTWIRNTQNLLNELKAIDTNKLPKRDPKPIGIPRLLYKLLEHPDLNTNPKI